MYTSLGILQDTNILWPCSSDPRGSPRRGSDTSSSASHPLAVQVIRWQFPLTHGMIRTAYSAQGLTLEGD